MFTFKASDFLTLTHLFRVINKSSMMLAVILSVLCLSPKLVQSDAKKAAAGKIPATAQKSGDIYKGLRNGNIFLFFCLCLIFLWNKQGKNTVLETCPDIFLTEILAHIE